MKFRAIVKKSGDWWIGWLIDLPGVNAQERTRKKLMESLRLAAEDILSCSVTEFVDGELTTIDVPEPRRIA